MFFCFLSVQEYNLLLYLLFLDSYNDDEFYGWAIEYENELIGTIGAYDSADDREFIEIGVSVASKYWGKGFATEAVKAVTEYPDVISPEEIKEILRISTSGVYHLLQAGTIKSIRVGKRYIIPKQSIIDFLSLD